MIKKGNRSNIMVSIISIIMFLLGIGIFFYPTVSNYIANKRFESIIGDYDNKYVDISEEDLSSEYEKALSYNKALIGEEVYDPFVPGTGYILPDNYEDVLNISKDGVMGYIEIPKISLKIPIYHGSSEDVLEKGIGHLETSALPIGGVGNNPILTGHRGLPRAELFTRLDELKKKDVIYIHVLNDILAYEIDNIMTILPTQVNTLGAIKEKDMITLITCTPYGVNTHRLVVQGKRIPYVEEKKELANSTKVIKLSESFMTRAIGIPLGLIILFILIFLLNKKDRVKEVISKFKLKKKDKDKANNSIQKKPANNKVSDKVQNNKKNASKNKNNKKSKSKKKKKQNKKVSKKKKGKKKGGAKNGKKN